jgi:hypothetical protein
MKELLRKTTELFRDYPVLWVPYLCGEVGAFALEKLRWLTTQQVALWVATRHSVLGGESQVYDPAAMHKAMIFSAPAGIVTRFTGVCLVTFAFVVTAQLTWMILGKQTPSIAQAAIVSLRQWRRILWFGGKFCICMIAGLLLDFLPALLSLGTFSVWDLRVRLHLSVTDIVWGCELLIYVVVAWMITPAAVRLLLPPEGFGISPMQRSIARKMAILAVATSTVLGYFYEIFRFKFRPDSAFEAHSAGAIATIVTNAPLLLLFIALAIVAVGKKEVPEPSADGAAAEDGGPQ